MSTLDLLRALRAHGATLTLQGDSVKVTAPAPLPDALTTALRAHKADVVAALQGQAPQASTALSPVHDARDPHATPSAPCAGCGAVQWRAESRDWRWQWVCGQCQPAAADGDAPRPRTAAELVATLPQAPCHGRCGRETAYGWECLSCRLAEGGGVQ